MEKKSKVTSTQANGTWDGKFGTMYKHEITFENGDCGEYSSKAKDQTKFVVGQESEYIFTDGQYPKVKPVFNKPFTSSSFTENPDRQRMIVKQSSLKCAVDLCIAGQNNGKTNFNHLDLKNVFAKAEEIVAWVMAESKVETPESAFTKVEKKVEPKEDLPF